MCVRSMGNEVDAGLGIGWWMCCRRFEVTSAIATLAEGRMRVIDTPLSVGGHRFWFQHRPLQRCTRCIRRRVGTLDSAETDSSSQLTVTYPPPSELRSLLETPKLLTDGPISSKTRQLSKALRTDLHKGLISHEPDLQNRRRLFGSNQLDPPPPVSFLEIMLDAFDDFTILILMASGVLSLILEYSIAPGGDYGWLEGTAILLSVTVVVLVTSFTNYQKEVQFRQLSALNEDVKVRVMRDGRECEISGYDLVVGDVLVVEGGDILPADGILIDGSSMRLDESHLTGESDEVVKSYETNPVVFSGSKVNEGVGHILILAVGKNSKQGSIAALASGQDTLSIDALKQQESSNGSLRQKTVLTVKLERLAGDIGRFGLAAALITLLAMSSQFSYHTFILELKPWSWEYLEIYLHQLITSITILVVAVPEGLPLASTLALAFSVQRMMKDNNLVRNLDACETMGSVTTICTDKTGTLTQNNLNVQQIWFGGKMYPIDALRLSQQSQDIIAEAISTNSTASLKTDTDSGATTRMGNRTECGLLKFVDDVLKRDFQTIRDRTIRCRVFPFSSDKKRMSVLIDHKNADQQQILSNGSNPSMTFHLKGAPELVVSLCTYRLDEDDRRVALSDEDRRRLMSDFTNNCSALRSLAFAFNPIERKSIDVTSVSAEELERGMTLIGIVGLSDDVRFEAPIAIKQCQRAGVDIKMLTGDNAETAESIAESCNIVREILGEGEIVEGPEFRQLVLDENGQLKSTEFKDLWKRLKVMARCSPEDKYLLVRGIQSIQSEGDREVIAMTGDGTNDAPALKIADVGFAMASGTPIAREASDILLLDDSFQSIVSAMKWGRNVLASVTKFLQFQLTVNVVAMITACTGAIWFQESPLSAVQMLWVNLIMDSLASLSLATEPPTDDVLDRPPTQPDDPILSDLVVRNIAGQCLYQLSVMSLLIFRDDLSGRDHQFTLVFNTFVCMQLANQINARKIYNEASLLDGLLQNRIFLTIWSSECILQYLIVQYGGMAFQTSPLELNDWLICIGFGALSLPIREGIRWSNTRER